MRPKSVQIIAGTLSLLAVIVLFFWLTAHSASGSSATASPTLWLAFAAGLLSFVSPCCLPLYPSYITYLTGMTFLWDGNQSLAHRFTALTHTLFFILGFSLVFLVLGLSATVLGQVFINNRTLLRTIGGGVILLMGLSLSGLLTPRWLMREKKWAYRSGKVGYGASVLVGVSFAAGWTPCIGPILASVLVMSASQPAAGLALILAYITGFSLPFFVLAFTLGSVRKLAPFGALLNKISGYVLIGLGLLLITNLGNSLTIWLIRLYGGFTGF